MTIEKNGERLKSVSVKPMSQNGQLEVELKNLAGINILVGQNGSGKTRLLNAIASLQLQNENGVTGEPQSEKLVFTNAYWEDKVKTLDLAEVDHFKYFREALRGLKISGELTREQIKFEVPGPLGSPAGRQVQSKSQVLHGPIQIALDAEKVANYFSAGTTRYAGLLQFLEGKLGTPEERLSNIEQTIAILLIDEIETSLHPSAHKDVLEELIRVTDNGITYADNNSAAGEPLKKVNVPVQVFVSTHSPFVVSAACDFPEKVKVYLLKDGKTLSVKNEPGGGENGYSGFECLFAANNMLGASLTDYAPSTLVLAEDSIQQFAKAAATKLGLPIPFFQASTSGDGNTRKSAETLLNLAKSYRDFGKANPWKNVLSLNICVVLDSKPSDEEERQWAELGRNTSFQRFTIATHEFEELHPRDLVNRFLEKRCFSRWIEGSFKDHALKLHHISCLTENKSKAEAVGKLKCELATFVGENIDCAMLQDNYKKMLPLFKVV